MIINGTKTENISINVTNYELITKAKELIDELYKPKGHYDKDKQEWGYWEEYYQFETSRYPTRTWITLETDKNKIKELQEKKDNYNAFLKIYEVIRSR